jgi:anti-sigma factor RsiW
MRSSHQQQHLSDEAIAAFADDVLARHARERARRHTAACPECNHAVAVQREAVWALRAAPAPSLPVGLLDRLRDVPATTPIRQVPTHVDEHGTTMFATFAAPAAAFVPAPSPRRGRTITMAVASAAVLGALATTAGSDRAPAPRAHPAGDTHIGLTRVDLPMHPR